MMNTKKTGGPAFPSRFTITGPAFDPIKCKDVPEGRAETYVEFGMTLRDYFAAKAPITTADAMFACGMGASSIGMLPRAERIVVMTLMAEMRGDYADAMLAEREKAGK
jgi:hypothetical protein